MPIFGGFANRPAATEAALEVLQAFWMWGWALEYARIIWLCAQFNLGISGMTGTQVREVYQAAFVFLLAADQEIADRTVRH